METVRRAITALNERDIDGYLACCTEDIVLRTPVTAVAGVFEGSEGIRRFFADIEDAGPDFRIEVVVWKRHPTTTCSHSCGSP